MRCSFRKLHSATQRVKSIVTPFAICTSFRHGSLLCPSSNFIHCVTFARCIRKYSFEIKTLMHWASLTPFISVAFSPPAANFSARLQVARASSKRSQATWRQIIYYFACASFCLVLSGAWHKSKPLRDLYLFRHAGNIVRTRTHRTSSCSRASHPRSTRRTARRTSDCKPFIRSVQLSAIAG